MKSLWGCSKADTQSALMYCDNGDRQPGLAASVWSEKQKSKLFIASLPPHDTLLCRKSTCAGTFSEQFCGLRLPRCRTSCVCQRKLTNCRRRELSDKAILTARPFVTRSTRATIERLGCHVPLLPPAPSPLPSAFRADRVCGLTRRPQMHAECQKLPRKHSG